jgi:hypothetical protein
VHRFGVFVHASSIHGRTHTSLTQPVVGIAGIRKAVTWVNTGSSSTLKTVPGWKAAGAWLASRTEHTP